MDFLRFLKKYELATEYTAWDVNKKYDMRIATICNELHESWSWSHATSIIRSALKFLQLLADDNVRDSM
jgi:hypothetical protein